MLGAITNNLAHKHKKISNLHKKGMISKLEPSLAGQPQGILIKPAKTMLVRLDRHHTRNKSTWLNIETKSLAFPTNRSSSQKKKRVAYGILTRML